MAFNIIPPNTPEVPIVVSVPHCGTQIPDEILGDYNPKMIESIDDTDFFVDALYDFVADMGITMISAKYSRWVIDLNRRNDNLALYDDGRVITALTPTTNFNGDSIYLKNEPGQKEVERRLETYYRPYYNQISTLLSDKKKRFKNVLFFDAHSIRKHVPGIQSMPFPDLILGDADETSAAPELIASAQSTLDNGDYRYSHNSPFKGGNLTRTFGQPDQNIHALQLEMSKTVYMDDTELLFDIERAEEIKKVLQATFEGLISTLEKMNQ